MYASEIHDRDSANCQLLSGNKRSALGRDATQTTFGRIPSHLSRYLNVSGLGLSRVLIVQRRRLICTHHSDTIHSKIGVHRYTVHTPIQTPTCNNLALDISTYAIDDKPQRDNRIDFSKMGLVVEFKSADISNPFRNPVDLLQPKACDFRFENDLDEARLVRGQLASYAAAYLGRQFRVHIFWVLVCGSRLTSDTYTGDSTRSIMT
ncbi:hypothetical protein PILCRDRAFT_618142 [Piloderma croceum F 1598]|uniref:Fungal-type protein kinase domain-containing protein n=1 Tax=Piloderma croceum (strain F 1598) TaxID=765440 RepID=A0A0C3EYI4_PILCF|nr:hypothetical protein PILCRDRAFT_618142 [Piloderma croceum F 1598]